MTTLSYSSEDTVDSEPLVPPDSPGSSVSSRFQEEYDELLKFAVIVPTYDPQTVPKTLQDLRGSFPPSSFGTSTQGEDELEDQDEDTCTEVEAEEEEHEESSEMLEDSNSRTPTHPVHVGGGISSKLFPDKSQEGSPDAASDIVMSPGEGITKEFTISLDHDVSRMENLLEQWTAELKKNVLGEFSQSKIRIIEHHRHDLLKEKEKHACDTDKLQNDIESLKELLHTYEQSIERKDQVISNLTQGLQKQREKYEKLKTFCEWKIQHNDLKREGFASNLAQCHYEQRLSKKCFEAWHSVLENKWKQGVEKACQAKAQEVCMSLTNDYEAKLKSLNEALEASREEVTRLHRERENYEETMKKAFMRGVCALNMEAMNMFHESDHGRTQPSPGTDEDLGEGPSFPVTISQEPVYTNEPPGAPPPRVITSQSASRGPVLGQSIMTQSKVGTKTTGKTLKTKVTARIDSGRGSRTAVGAGQATLAPPMSSVVVERHQPVTKQTIGQATAAKYPQGAGRPVTSTSSLGGPSQQPPPVVQRRGTGQPLATPNVHTVKVVD